jgi:hypothetical protein
MSEKSCAALHDEMSDGPHVGGCWKMVLKNKVDIHVTQKNLHVRLHLNQHPVGE